MMRLRLCQLFLLAIVTGDVKNNNINNGTVLLWLYPTHPDFIVSFVGLHRLEPTKPAVKIDFGHEVIYSNFAVIGMSETWLDSTMMDSELKIDNYVLNRRDRNRNGGGVCAYIRADIAFKPRMDLACYDLESVWIELLLPKTKPSFMNC